MILFIITQNILLTLEHILSKKKLLLSKRKDSKDPVENLAPLMSSGGLFRPGTGRSQINYKLKRN